MSESSSSSSSGGVGFGGLLTIAFIVLKLTHYIDWSWWWVLSPLWISVAAVLAVLGGLGLGVLALTEIDDRRSRKRFRERTEKALNSSPIPAREARDRNAAKSRSWLN